MPVSIRPSAGRTSQQYAAKNGDEVKTYEFLFVPQRDVRRNPTFVVGAVTSANDVRFHTRRFETLLVHAQTPLGSAFVLVRGLHTRGPFRPSSRQPPATGVTDTITSARRGPGVSRHTHSAAQ